MMLPLLAPSLAALVLWMAVAARCFGALGVQLLFVRVVGPWWIPVCGALSLLLGPLLYGPVLAVDPGALDRAAALAGAGNSTVWWVLMGSLGLEALLGAVIGAAVTLPAAGALGVSELFAGQRRGRAEALTPLVVAATLVTAFGLGLHHHALAALTALFVGFGCLDPGGWVSTALRVQTLVEHLHAVLVLALALCSPVWLTRMVASLIAGAWASGSRVAQSSSRVISSGLAASLGLLALYAAIESYPHVWGRSLSASISVSRTASYR